MPHNQKDIIMKALMGTFSDNALGVLGVKDVELVAALPTELNSLAQQIDMAWLTQSGEVFHLEFQTTRESTLHRFLEYDARLARQYQTTVRTVVLYHNRVTDAPEELNIGTAQYRVENVYLNQFDGDAVLHAIERNLDFGTWTPSDRVQLALALNMRFSRQSEAQAMDQVLSLVGRVTEPQERDFICAALIGLTNRVLSESEWLRMKKELKKMSDMARELYDDGRQDGREEGRQEGLHNALEALKMLRNGASIEFVAKQTGFTIKEVEEIAQQIQ